jgi:hypothetical protein
VCMKCRLEGEEEGKGDKLKWLLQLMFREI